MDPIAPQMHDLLEQARPTLLALKATDLLRPRISRERALTLTRTLKNAFEPHAANLAAELCPARAAERKADFDALEPRTFIYYAADLAVESPWTSDKKTRRAELVEKVREHDHFLLGWAIPLFKHD